MMNSKRKKIYEGKAKILYEGPEPGTLIQYFKDDATAFNAQKKATLEGKGVINNRISEFVMTRLNGIGVTNHFIKRLNLREQLIREVEIIPLEVVCRNIVAGSLLTDSFGLVTFFLDAGTYYVHVRKDGFNPLQAQETEVS